jgi:hypothetical protein
MVRMGIRTLDRRAGTYGPQIATIAATRRRDSCAQPERGGSPHVNVYRARCGRLFTTFLGSSCTMATGFAPADPAGAAGCRAESIGARMPGNSPSNRSEIGSSQACERLNG